MDGRATAGHGSYPPAYAQQGGGVEYSRAPDISTQQAAPLPGYPPAVLQSYPVQTAPFQRSGTPTASDYDEKPAAGPSYPPVPAAPTGYATSSSYGAKPDHSAVQMGTVKDESPRGAQQTANIADAPYRPYSPGRNGRPVAPGAPPVQGRPTRPTAGSIPAPYDNDRWQQDVRRGFVRKVLLLVAIQLLITAGVSIAFYTIDPIRDYLAENQWPVWVCMLISFGILLTIVCVPATHKFPFDYILLFGFTTFFSVCVGAITGRYSVQAVGLALAVTCATVFGAFFVAAFTKLDLTKISGFLLAVLFGVIAMTIIGIFWRNKWFHFVIALVSAILFTMFLIYDLQMLMGGRSREFDPDMYVIAALNIYIDIIQIFLNVLQIIGLLGGGD